MEAAEECLRRLTRYLSDLALLADPEQTAAEGALAHRARPPDSSEFAVARPDDLIEPGAMPPDVRAVVSWAVGWLRWVGSWYLDTVTRSGTSVGRLLFSSFVVVALFGFIHAFILDGWERGFWSSILTFLLQPSIIEVYWSDQFKPLRDDSYFNSLIVAELGVAYLHLSLLVSVLYRRITRRAP
jgi:hypothetical protein